MSRLDLDEWSSSEHCLTVAQRDALQAALKPSALKIEHVSGVEGKYLLTTGSTVGAFEVGDLSVLIQPKIEIPHLLSIACFAIGKVNLRSSDFDFPERSALPDVLALALGRAARYAFSRGLLHGYISREESLQTVRGRIRFEEQLRRRPGVLLPIEVRYDEFTDDILANRLVKSAALKLAVAGLRSERARNELRWIAGMLDNVSQCEWLPSTVPEVTFDRLNEHYKDVVTLSRLVLRGGAFEARKRGKVRAQGFLMDMNAVFQEFVTVSLRESLGLSKQEFRERSIDSLDMGNKVRLKPDLVWWQAGRHVFVGDAKYKNITGDRIPNDDLYQILAYVTALGLRGGMLVYAEGECNPETITVRNAGTQLEIASLDISGSLVQVLERVASLAKQVRRLRNEAEIVRPAA